MSVANAVFFNVDRVCRNMLALQNEMLLVRDDPMDLFTLFELHCLRYGGREVDVPLFALLALDALNLCWVSHQDLL